MNHCITCQNLTDCPLLVDLAGQFNEQAVVLEGSTCPSWQPASERTVDSRVRVFEITGMAAIKGLHQLKRLMEQARPKEEEDVSAMTKDEAFQYFRSIIRPGMLRSEREQQLRFVTNKEGTVILNEQGDPYPREQAELKRYIQHEESGINEPPDRTLFWDMEQLVEAITAAELDAQLITQNPRKGKKEPNMPTFSTRGGVPVPPTAQDEQMATAQVPPIPQQAAPARVAKPATGTKRNLFAAKDAAPEQATPPPVASLPPRVAQAVTQAQQGAPTPVAMDPRFIEDITASTVRSVDAIMTKRFNELSTQIDQMRERITMQNTVIHDLVLLVLLDPQRFNQDSLLVPAGGSIEDYLDGDKPKSGE